MREPGDHIAAARRREEETWIGVGEDWLDSMGESEPLDIGRPLAQDSESACSGATTRIRPG